jgi:para-nitrobenzyl esterase
MADALGRDERVYAYEFNDRSAPAPDPLHTVPFPVGASHSLELRYLFDMRGAPPLDPAQRKLSDQMIDYWSEFVATGVPRAEDQPEWPELGDDLAAGKFMSLRPDGSRVVTDFEQAHQCAFWAGLKG